MQSFLLDDDYTEFQFHYGTIISESDTGGVNCVIEFQFHYGTIISIIYLLIFNFRNQFQFHYGTIIRC